MTAREVYNQTFDDSTLLVNNEDRGSWPNVEAIPVGNAMGREKFCCTDAMTDYGGRRSALCTAASEEGKDEEGEGRKPIRNATKCAEKICSERSCSDWLQESISP